MMKDKRVIFYGCLKKLDDLSYLKYYLKYQLAPVIMGFKCSTILTLGKQNRKNITKQKSLQMIKALRLEAIVLREQDSSHILLVYRPCLLEALLEEDANRDFLKSMEYNLTSIDAVLADLTKRYQNNHCPHEIGLFLGFDLDDVKDYMNCSNKQCLLCGYWRVYNHVNQAKKTFATYDFAKISMLGYLLNELKVVS